MEETQMNLPFTPEQFFDVFARYNVAVWPIQVVLYGLAIAALVLALKHTSFSNQVIALILVGFWLWIGVVYHLTFFTSINGAAYVFGGLFIVQSVLFFIAGVWHTEISFKPHLSLYSVMGALFILYGLLIYPIWGYFLGHVYPASPTFGVPCPTTIFTFGLLLWTKRRFPKYLLAIPALWSIIAISAVTQMGVLEDIMLLITGLTATALILYRDKTAGKLTPNFSA